MPKTDLTPDQALARLAEGNRHFVAGDAARPDLSASRRHALTAGQAPFAAVLGCADSRVPPEMAFSTGLGEIFTIRVAGNSVGTGELGSLEYAVNMLGVPLIVVLGHERCGAVAAALEVAEKGTSLPGALEPMINPILASMKQAHEAGGDLADQTARAHAVRTARHLRDDEQTFSALAKAGKLRIVAAHYRLEDGLVSWLDG